MYRFFYSLLLFSFLLSSCAEKETNNVVSQDLAKTLPTIPSFDIPNDSIELSELTFDKKISIWTYKNKRYSGYGITRYENGYLKEKTGFKDGRKENESIHYYPDGHYKRYSNYHKGKLHGEKKSWSSASPHILIAHYNYYLGKAHGVQKQWYVTGELYKSINLNMGKEEGMQRAYRKNGVLYANYEAKNGRIFGLKKSKLCFNLEDEEVIYVE